jgi:hypothetical protein
MPFGRLSARIDAGNARHHLWLNNGTWWVHYTLNFDFRTRRVRRLLETSSLDEAILRRDALFLRLASQGEWVPERGPDYSDTPCPPTLTNTVRQPGVAAGHRIRAQAGSLGDQSAPGLANTKATARTSSSRPALLVTSNPCC